MLAAKPGASPLSEPSASETSEDSILVSAARAGDRTAFGHLYERYARMVHGMLLARVPHSEVDDLVQDVFMLALRRLSTLRESGKFGAWLAAIARNRANDYHRQSTPEGPSPDDLHDQEIESATTSGDQATPAAILEVIKSLPSAYRETLILRLIEGMTGPEIAARTGMTHGSVRVNLHRGMQQLRAKLGSSPSEGDSQQEKG